MYQEARKPTVILDFIDHEIESSYECVDPDTRARLGDAAHRQFLGEISLDESKRIFLQSGASDSLPTKIQQILDVTDVPLPPPSGDAQANPTRGTRRKSFPWTDAEDVRLLVAVSRFGARDWRMIAEFVGSGRSSSQCNQRWCRALDPSISHRSWTEADDYKLIRAVDVLGKASWCQVAKIMPGRTDLQCRYRYLQLVKTSDAGGERPANESPPDVDMEAVMQSRRNSICIARFTIELEDRINLDVKSTMLPYYLESSLVPRNDPTARYLHRVPPLLCSRVSRK